ncbi:hypothetical protein BGZ61DRAFT_533090 [Ilyonectria robusta]|uniref:uncharacterized protein n=1 Tax=Ilyonectria robusta TaxID=1079257 RepID=UPI001E8D7A75|nr:uncharacterized protein BGZ61DRAFT_533090 [Ilyonectria robusta]KAH8688300.1 hypothetical protein BGZ61DRAFT_533090 [Ilyonectria robusta]
MSSFYGEEIARIRKSVGPTAQLIEAVCEIIIPDACPSNAPLQLTGDPAQLVNNGAMRLNECKQVKETLAQHLGISLTVVDATDRSATNDTSANI